jgi:hypothetical protein
MLCLLQLYYLDHLHDSAAPQNKRGTPRIKYFDRNIIQALTRADKGKIRKGEEAFGHCSVFFLMCQSFFLVLLHISHIFLVPKLLRDLLHRCTTRSCTIQGMILFIYLFVIEFQHNIQLYAIHLLNNFQFTTA